MRHSVNSSSIDWVEESGRGSLIVHFKAGGTYEYEGVPLDTINALIEAPSVGRFFNSEIRGNYEERKISDD